MSRRKTAWILGVLLVLPMAASGPADAQSLLAPWRTGCISDLDPRRHECAAVYGPVGSPEVFMRLGRTRSGSRSGFMLFGGFLGHPDLVKIYIGTQEFTLPRCSGAGSRGAMCPLETAQMVGIVPAFRTGKSFSAVVIQADPPIQKTYEVSLIGFARAWGKAMTKLYQ